MKKILLLVIATATFATATIGGSYAYGDDGAYYDPYRPHHPSYRYYRYRYPYGYRNQRYYGYPSYYNPGYGYYSWLAIERANIYRFPRFQSSQNKSVRRQHRQEMLSRRYERKERRLAKKEN